MRMIRALPLVAAFVLAACGSSEEPAADEALSAEDVVAEAATAIKPNPGQYTSKIELLEFDMPGMPESAKAQMKQMAEGSMAEGNSFCMTEADADPKKMMENIAESQCTFNSFEVAGGTVKADMMCKGADGSDAQVQMDGQMTPDSSTMTMAMQQQLPAAGKVSMTMRVTSTRTGECS